MNDTVRLPPFVMVAELDALVNDLIDLAIEPSDWLAGEPRMDSWMDSAGAAAGRMGP